ncbi:fimbrial protein [Providencia manganoxydans]|uniref:fimbrial protein n=1 Tax=Providencia manganoxydans TaxID=2923283 RepID=UPI0034E435F2
MNNFNRKRAGWLPISAALCVCSALPSVSLAVTSNEIQYSGRLIALPCTVDPNFENLVVDFGGNINSKDLVGGQRRYNKEDILFHLTDCDPSLGNTISAKFSGVSVTANGLLNVDEGSHASGIAVGLETPSGVALPINNTHVEPVIPITQGEMTIRVRSYLQAVEGATVETIEPGFFTATLTYTLIYE